MSLEFIIQCWSDAGYHDEDSWAAGWKSMNNVGPDLLGPNPPADRVDYLNGLAEENKTKPKWRIISC